MVIMLALSILAGSLNISNQKAVNKQMETFIHLILDIRCSNSYRALKVYSKWATQNGYPKINTNEFHQQMIRYSTYMNNIYQIRT